MVSDGIAGATGSAIEEVAVVSTHQYMAEHVRRNNPDAPVRWKCKLVEIPGVEWRTGFEGNEIRKKQHMDKMQSKIRRAKAQNLLLGIPIGTVEHISHQ